MKKNQYHQKITAFTLVELMIAVVILGVLSAITIIAFQKHILKSKAAEAPLLLKTLYDAESIFASRRSMTIRDQTYGDVQCKPLPSFLALCIHDEAELYRPISKKVNLFFHSIDSVVYSPEDNTCALHEQYSHPKFVGLGLDNETQQINHGTIKVARFSRDPSYYLMRAKKDSVIASEYGVPINDTLMISVFGDLDGDNTQAIFCGQNGSPSQTYHRNNKLGIYARAMHIDQQGQLQGSGMIVLNPLE